MSHIVYCCALALSVAETQPRPTYPPPPVDLAKRMAKVPACVSLPATSQPSSSRLSSSSEGGQSDESAVLAGVNSIAERLPQTKCEARVK